MARFEPVPSNAPGADIKLCAAHRKALPPLATFGVEFPAIQTLTGRGMIARGKTVLACEEHIGRVVSRRAARRVHDQFDPVQVLVSPIGYWRELAEDEK